MIKKAKNRLKAIFPGNQRYNIPTTDILLKLKFIIFIRSDGLNKTTLPYFMYSELLRS